MASFCIAGRSFRSHVHGRACLILSRSLVCCGGLGDRPALRFCRPSLWVGVCPLLPSVRFLQEESTSRLLTRLVLVPGSGNSPELFAAAGVWISPIAINRCKLKTLKMWLICLHPPPEPSHPYYCHQHPHLQHGAVTPYLDACKNCLIRSASKDFVLLLRRYRQRRVHPGLFLFTQNGIYAKK